MPKPATIIAHLAGSGTAADGLQVTVSTPPRDAAPVVNVDRLLAARSSCGFDASDHTAHDLRFCNRTLFPLRRAP